MGRSPGLPVSGAVMPERMVSWLVASMGAMGSEKVISSSQITHLSKARMWKALVMPGKPEASKSMTRSCHSVVMAGWLPSARTRSQKRAA